MDSRVASALNKQQIMNETSEKTDCTEDCKNSLARNLKKECFFKKRYTCIRHDFTWELSKNNFRKSS